MDDIGGRPNSQHTASNPTYQQQSRDLDGLSVFIYV